MRLLRTASPRLELIEFHGDSPKPYAILSHTWEEQEVLYSDLDSYDYSSKKGYLKLSYAIQQAQNDGFEYLWVDTCCIDKSSSAELSEAINSMYEWYKQAAICYVYMSDVAEASDDFEKSRWFTRGWTLQELLAPRLVNFYSGLWKFLGDKKSLSFPISGITGIEIEFLTAQKTVTSASVAKRMFWASARETTRIEDMAYCLLGIFSVSMPLLYGERDRAFIRLQEEIVKITDDQTLFAWKDATVKDQSLRKALLAEHPRYFAGSSRYAPCQDPESKEPHSINISRVKVELRLTVRSKYDPVFLGLLSCVDEANPGRLLAINLELISTARQEYQRISCHRLWLNHYKGSLRTIFVPQIAQLMDLRPPMPRPADISVWLRSFHCATNGNSELRGCVVAPQTRNERDRLGVHLQRKLAGTQTDSLPFPYPTYFVCPLFAATPILALHLSFQGRQVTFLLGTTSDMEIGSCAILDLVSQDFDVLREKFTPSTSSLLLIFPKTAKDSNLKLLWYATPYRDLKLSRTCYVVDLVVKNTTRLTVAAEGDAKAVSKRVDVDI